MGAYWVKRAGQFFYSAANLIRTRSTSDRVVLGVSDQGTTDQLSADAGSDTLRSVVVRGLVQSTGMVLQEIASNQICGAYLSSASGTLSNVGVYVKSNQFVIAHVCGANGQIKYATLTLDGLSCTWVQSGTAP